MLSLPLPLRPEHRLAQLLQSARALLPPSHRLVTGALNESSHVESNAPWSLANCARVGASFTTLPPHARRQLLTLDDECSRLHAIYRALCGDEIMQTECSGDAQGSTMSLGQTLSAAQPQPQPSPLRMVGGESRNHERRSRIQPQLRCASLTRCVDRLYVCRPAASPYLCPSAVLSTAVCSSAAGLSFARLPATAAQVAGAESARDARAA